MSRSLHVALRSHFFEFEMMRRAFGKPDGWLPRARCSLFGHRWEPCNENCCEGERSWCRWCLAPLTRPPAEEPGE